MDLGLKNAHVLVTGSSGGIGIETTRQFLSQCARVTAHYNTHASPLAPLLDEYGPTRMCLTGANLADEDQVEKMFDDIQKRAGIFGPVQVLVINHGVWPAADVPLAQMSLAQWNATLASNLTSTFLVAREYLRRLRVPTVTSEQRKHAAIVIIGSTAGKYGEAGHADYAACKSAMMYGLLLSLKNEIVKIAPQGRVNCVAPGWVHTPMAEAALKNPDVIYRALSTTPLKKVATPHDVASQIMLLASPVVSGHVTGQVIMVDGGMEGRLLNDKEDVM